MEEETKAAHTQHRHRRGKSRRVLLGVIVLETVLLLICMVLGIRLFQRVQVPEVPETVPTTAPQEVTEPPASTGPLLSQAELAIQTFCTENGLSPTLYPESLVDLLERNPETKEFVLNYPLEYGTEHEIDLSEYEGSEAMPLFMQWDRRWGYIDYGADVAGLTACGPVCLSMVAYYLTGDPNMSPDKIIQFAIDNGYCVPGNGSAWTLISEGGKALGLDVTEIPLDKNRVMDNLEVGNPIICIMGPGDFTTDGHFIVLSGTENGQIRINDPNSFSNSERLWSFEEIADQILDLWVLRNLGQS